ncbi:MULTISPECIES: ABC transporter permease [Glycomyces]|uniref:Peptide ABC transporter permease n=2 Tax=Glycomyces TaxID=58113 RepID=A0A9W6LHU6_9ACTN|nr:MULTISPECIES: ABC transporter permease [Glycomyces]MDA1364458.1 ABC transporter permease [Glycomyces algeriensis]MDN3241574.1 ABC transporter permease [Glycomyces tritici]MDN3242361.1 ABC transporter permease [Glycomyces tritici]MDR7350491.1 peptide/nickel transport system permease protein [Glycomyces algeriensis]GLI43199.1 peptide ABC transporter permease [Glycomyces algeriensis]
MSYFLRKIGFYAIALWAALTLNFAIPRMLPGNPVDILLAKLQQRGGAVSPETRKAYALLLGGDDSRPLWTQYWDYLGNMFRGDLGVSVSYYPAPVSEVISQSIPWTVVLVGLSTIIAAVLGVALGAFVGWKPGTWLDSLIPATTLLAAVPYFWLALLLTYLLARVLGWFPMQGGYDVVLTPGWNWEFIASAIQYGFLPALTIVLASIGGWLLGMRNMMVSTLSEDYILTAEAKGLTPRKILRSYASRNAVLPSVAGFALSLGFVVTGSVITEQVFSYPGIGNRLLGAVQNNDYALMQGVFLFITLAVLGANLVVDLLYGVIDPRTRARN